MDSWPLVMFNIFFTSWPSLAVGIWDRLFPFEMMIDYPALYHLSQNNPDIITSVEQPIPQNILLCLLNQLATKLDEETDLKFRDPTTAGSYRHVLNRLQTCLTGEDIVSCDERLFLKLESLINENRTSAIEAMQISLDLKMDSQQQTMDLHVVRDELASNIREVLMTSLIPILQDALFQQLNENFRTDLEQYMK
ncbi:unnamed protein product [Brugia pahangi]|uniref:PhoLip_ATPase_C domain-containing protein n=1 Tax=Brugia pahangi TaxID=6280 RepID=A0A0N4TZY0_BRUPA|nr:unnamed protein product [Brugia pahangi]